MYHYVTYPSHLSTCLLVAVCKYRTLSLNRGKLSFRLSLFKTSTGQIICAICFSCNNWDVVGELSRKDDNGLDINYHSLDSRPISEHVHHTVRRPVISTTVIQLTRAKKIHRYTIAKVKYWRLNPRKMRFKVSKNEKKLNKEYQKIREPDSTETCVDDVSDGTS